MYIDNKKAIWGIWLVFLLLVHTSCTNSISRPERTLNLLPEPAQLTIGKEAFILQDNMIICINDSSLNPAADYLVTILQRATGYKFVVKKRWEWSYSITYKRRITSQRWQLHIKGYPGSNTHIFGQLCRCNSCYINSPSNASCCNRNISCCFGYSLVNTNCFYHG